MAIESVTSTTYAPPQPKLKTDQADQAAQAGQAGQSLPANGARDAAGMSRDNEATEPQAPQPVVNAQGQVTGKIINAIA